MNIAIYGDSFADPNFRAGPLQSWDPRPSAWPTLLGQIYTLKNYARAGTGLYWSYQQFLSTHSQHDRIVFIVTAVGRWPTLIEGRAFGNSLEALDYHIKSVDLSREDLRRKLVAVRDWVLWARDWDYERSIHELILSDIRRSRPDALLIPIVGDTESLRDRPSVTDWARASLWTLTGDPRWRDTSNLPPLLKELRTACHMTPETNRSFLMAVGAALQSGLWQPRVPESILHKESVDYYYGEA